MVYESYVICTSPRSGSTLLCKLLAATGVAGNPDSYFHRHSISEWLADLGLTTGLSIPEPEVLEAIFRAAIARGSLETGIFGLRLQRQSFNFFMEKLGVLHPGCSSDSERFHKAFGRTLFVHLTRRDKVEQAVSYVKAQQTGLWHAAPNGTELERLSPPKELVYDHSEIRTCTEGMAAYDRDWERWFTAARIDPLQITYEELSARPTDSLRAMLGHLGVDCRAADGVEPEVAKLANDVNRDWVARFRSKQHEPNREWAPRSKANIGRW